jgi:Right handed beta helix region
MEKYKLRVSVWNTVVRRRLLILLSILLANTASRVELRAAEIRVQNSSQLRATLRNLTPGTTILLAPGMYEGNIYVQGAAGAEQAPIIIEGTDPNDPPVFSGGRQAIHLADCRYLVLRNLRVVDFPSNGINIDDAGSYETPADHITLENVTILKTGPKGNHDAIKMSGVDHFMVKRCHFEGWGGSGIDMVGCHHGVIEDCTFVGRKGFSQSNAVQLKGGTEDVLVQTSLFKNAGQRAINLGGSTGLQFFRPRVGDYEAKNITVAGNRFVGSAAPIAWVTADGGYVHHNTIVCPENWILRILQETKDARFRPCHDGVFENNLVIYDSRIRDSVNIGPGTAPETFVFSRNAWYNLNGRAKPALPTVEKDGLYLTELNVDRAAMEQGIVNASDERLKGIGAQHYKKAMKRQTNES